MTSKVENVGQKTHIYTPTDHHLQHPDAIFII